MLVLIFVITVLIGLVGVFSVVNENDSQKVHVSEYEKLIKMHETVLNSSPELVAEMKERLVKIKLNYGIKTN